MLLQAGTVPLGKVAEHLLQRGLGDQHIEMLQLGWDIYLFGRFFTKFQKSRGSVIVKSLNRKRCHLFVFQTTDLLLLLRHGSSLWGIPVKKRAVPQGMARSRSGATRSSPRDSIYTLCVIASTLC